MTTTTPLKRTHQSFVDLVYSQNDGGWYIEESNLNTAKRRVSKKLWRTGTAASAAYHAGKVQWKRWD